MRRLGNVSTEGGPLIIGDLRVVAEWRGTSCDDYDRACDALDQAKVPAAQWELPSGAAVVWDVPAGTAEVWRSEDTFVVSRAWYGSDVGETSLRLTTQAPNRPVPLGMFSVTTDWLLVMWAVEDGRDAAAVTPSDGRSLDLSVGGAGLIAAAPNRDYGCRGDEVTYADAEARRCLIAPDRPPGAREKGAASK